MEWDNVAGMLFLLTIITIAVTAGQLIHRRSVRHEERKLELELQIEQAKKGQAVVQSQSAKQMEDRLRVLERIATDPSTNISQQIESLRDIKADGEKVT